MEKMEKLMRTLLSLAWWAVLTAGVAGGTPDSADVRCFDSIVRSIPVEEPITVVTNDSASIRGILPAVIPLSSALYLWPDANSSFGSSVVIPIGRINRITYTKPSPMKPVLVLLGLGLGMIAGGSAGAALAPESHDFMD